jgi:hypothetical protein
MFVIPAAGMKVPDPAHPKRSPAYFLPAEGREVEDSLYWTRRVRDGDVTVGAAPAPAAGAEAPDVA